MIRRIRQYLAARRLQKIVARQKARNEEHARFREASLKGWRTRRGL